MEKKTSSVIKSSDSDDYVHNCIVIGSNLTATMPYELMISRNGIKIHKIMTKEEYRLLNGLMIAIAGI